MNTARIDTEFGVNGIFGVLRNEGLLYIVSDFFPIDGIGERQLGAGVLHIHQKLIALDKLPGLAERARIAQGFFNRVVKAKFGNGNGNGIENIILIDVDLFTGFQPAQIFRGDLADIDGQVRFGDLFVISVHGIRGFAHSHAGKIRVSKEHAIRDAVRRFRLIRRRKNQQACSQQDGEQRQDAKIFVHSKESSLSKDSEPV